MPSPREEAPVGAVWGDRCEVGLGGLGQAAHWLAQLLRATGLTPLSSICTLTCSSPIGSGMTFSPFVTMLSNPLVLIHLNVTPHLSP